MNLKDTLRQSMMSQIATALGSSGHLLIYTGTAPSKTAAPTGTLLATFALPSTAGTASGPVLTFGTIASVTASASGTPGYARFIDGSTDDGTHTQIQCSCGVGSGELNWGSTIASGGTASISSATITEGDP